MVMGARPHVNHRKPGRETRFSFGVALPGSWVILAVVQAVDTEAFLQQRAN